jgi:electron transport complex protein RnfC
MTYPLIGGLDLDGHRKISTQLPVERAPIPDELVLPLSQHAGMPARAIVEVGDHVAAGQLIAERQGFISANIHAPIDSVVKAIELRPVSHPSGLNGMCIVLSPNPGAKWPEYQDIKTRQTEINQYDPEVIRQTICDAGIVGLGGAVFPTSVKVKTGIEHHVETLIINGCECEPWITCDEMLFREHPQQIIAGACLLQQAVNANRRVLAIESEEEEAISNLQNAIVDCGDSIDLQVMSTQYPTGSERQLIYRVTGREVPADGLPADVGAAVFNAGTAAAVYRAVVHNQPLTSRYVTVTGYGIKQPRVLEVLIGTSIATLIEYCGGCTHDANGLIMGGSMMGLGIPSDEVPVTKAMNCILITTHDMTRDEQGEMPCIRCGECAKACPAKLMPQQLLAHAKANDLEQSLRWHLESCIECGCCNAVCPSHIPLVSYFRHTKSEIRAQGRAKSKAHLAKQRHEAREARLEKARKEREERLKKKKERLKKSQPLHDKQTPEKAQASLKSIEGKLSNGSQDNPGDVA